MIEGKADDPELAKIKDAVDSILYSYRDKEPIPHTIYQYTSLESALKIIEARTIWCSNLRYSNDPSEATYGKLLLDDILDHDPQLKLQGARAVIADLDTYAASFSAEGDLLPQWRAYCRNGRGVALGVPFQTLQHRKSMILVRVIYDEPEQRQFINDILNVFRASLLSAFGNTSRLQSLIGVLASYLAIARSALKSSAYESEREYRLLDLLPNQLRMSQSGVQFRVSGGSVIPYLVADVTQSLPEPTAEPISEIRVGPW